MGPLATTLTAYLNATNFGGHDSRSDFWGLALWLVLILGGIALLGEMRPDLAAPHLAAWAGTVALLRARAIPAEVPGWLTPEVIALNLFLGFTLLTLIAATVRRLRDARQPKKLWLLWFLPGPGTLALAWALSRPTFDPTPKIDAGAAYRAPDRSWFRRRRAKDAHGVFRNRMAFRKKLAQREREEAARINPFSV